MYQNENEKNIDLCTFPDDDKDYCKVFTVSKEWLTTALNGESIESFLDRYTWDETFVLYLNAGNEESIINEYEQS